MAPNAIGSNLCTSASCVHIASEILGSLALNYTEIDPCEDFEQYVCGNWAARHEIPAGDISTDGLTLAQENVASALRQILESPYPTGDDAGWITVNLTKEQSKADKEIFSMIQDTYQVCTNYSALEGEGLQTLHEVVKTVVDLYPATGNKTASNTTQHSVAMGKTLTFFESIGIQTFQRFIQKQKDTDPDAVQLTLFPLQPDELVLPATEQDLQEYIKIASQLLAVVHPSNISTTAAAKLITSVIELEGKLVAASALAEQNGPTSAIVSIDEAQKQFPGLNYEYVIEQLAPKNWKGDVQFIVPVYFNNASQIISETPTTILQGYFVWKAITSISIYIEDDLTNAYNDLVNNIRDRDPETTAPRWKRCINLMNYGVAWTQGSQITSQFIGPTGLTWILSRFFVDKHFSPEANELTSNLVQHIKDSFSERIESWDWATDEVKKASIEKVEAMQKIIGLPTFPDAVDPIALKEYYSEVKIQPSLALTALSFAKSKVKNNWATLGKPYNRGQFVLSTLTANAYNARTLNQIVLFAGFQQFPIYDVDFPSYLLYGGMGSVVGHEITHGFDNIGRSFDTIGNATQWWDEESIKAFEEKTKCFVEQYNNFTILAPNGTDVHVNGTLTLDENIADAGGVSSSYEAWKKWESEKGKARNLPGLQDFTHEQLFFIKWGQTWCSNVSPKLGLTLLEDDVHSPAPARVLLPLKNTNLSPAPLFPPSISVNAMAEAIGLVASVASLLDLALKLSNSLHNLQFQFRNAPYLIQALENETGAIRTVLACVETSICSAVTARLGGPGNSGILGDLTAEIGKGAAVLKDLGTFVDSLKNETSTLRRVKWVHKREKAAELIKELKEVRSRISELQLAYGNSSLARIELVLQDIQVMQRLHYAKTHSLGACLLDTRDQITIARDTTFQNQSDVTAALEALQNIPSKLPPEWGETISNQLATSINTMRPGVAKDNITDVSPHQSHKQQSTQAIFSPLQHSTLSLNLRLVQSQCSITCTCRCHASVASYRPWNTLPKKLQMIMGSVLFEYSSCPVSRTTCDLHSCSKSRLTRLTVRYGFPFWSFKYAIHILVEKVSANSLMFTLALRRKIPLEASRDNIIFQATIGNLDAVKRIVFENPTAILDVNHYGDSALCICISRLLPWELSSGKADILAQIHSEDRFGMTPLMYAIALGDAKAAEALMKAGASVHKKGPYGRNLVDYVAFLPTSTCTALLDLLLRAGADATTVYSSGWTLLHTAALHDNATMMDRLVHEGASFDLKGLDVDAIDAKGLTATDVFENRYDKTNGLMTAFYQLKDSIKLKSSHGTQDESKDEDIDEFFDAHEFLCYGRSC
ncbi:endothelin-converting enzyme 1 [Fusarium agapanthi]|uniref:Endothelin-converting enzyme 1 n=1 Tax=Fusarium agapanthi TaxID=1803897 RepID=A0A9P5B285_9HYPO|nr:endothelin-converting enzyme 1 [Fusarium agapanthi]